MSTNSSNNSGNQEIDLSQISNKINGFFDGISNRVFRIFLFVRKNILLLAILFILGAGIGAYLDKTVKLYENEIIVAPNFGSNDYLYSKIALINSKIKEDDTLFLKNTVGIKEPEKFRKILVEPINDVYKFVDNNEENFELIKLMAEDGDLKKILEENTTSKNYPYHRIQFVTKGLTSEKETVEPLLNYLNQSEYYSAIQKEFLNNITIKLKANDSIIKQIDGVLNSFASTVDKSQHSEKLVYYNENTQLNDVIKTKNELVYEQGLHRVELVNLQKVIKENGSTLNIKQLKGFDGKAIFILPFLFIFIYIFILSFKSFYSKHSAKANA